MRKSAAEKCRSHGTGSLNEATEQVDYLSCTRTQAVGLYRRVRMRLVSRCAQCWQASNYRATSRDTQDNAMVRPCSWAHFCPLKSSNVRLRHHLEDTYCLRRPPFVLYTRKIYHADINLAGLAAVTSDVAPVVTEQPGGSSLRSARYLLVRSRRQAVCRPADAEQFQSLLCDE